MLKQELLEKNVLVIHLDFARDQWMAPEDKKGINKEYLL